MPSLTSCSGSTRTAGYTTLATPTPTTCRVDTNTSSMTNRTTADSSAAGSAPSAAGNSLSSTAGRPRWRWPDPHLPNSFAGCAPPQSQSPRTPSSSATTPTCTAPSQTSPPARPTTPESATKHPPADPQRIRSCAIRSRRCVADTLRLPRDPNKNYRGWRESYWDSVVRRQTMVVIVPLTRSEICVHDQGRAPTAIRP